PQYVYSSEICRSGWLYFIDTKRKTLDNSCYENRFIVHACTLVQTTASPRRLRSCGRLHEGCVKAAFFLIPYFLSLRYLPPHELTMGDFQQNQQQNTINTRTILTYMTTTT
ncbi:unnamed protein product, partial [Ectocarpus sp. 6 AP-2014]